MDKYNDFGERHNTLLHSILDDRIDELGNLIYMLKTLASVKSGKLTMIEANAMVREKLSSEYIYPKFGGKTQFEKAIKKRAKHGANQ
jgi:hypothetical protein